MRTLYFKFQLSLFFISIHFEEDRFDLDLSVTPVSVGKNFCSAVYMCDSLKC